MFVGVCVLTIADFIIAISNHVGGLLIFPQFGTNRRRHSTRLPLNRIYRFASLPSNEDNNYNRGANRISEYRASSSRAPHNEWLMQCARSLR